MKSDGSDGCIDYSMTILLRRFDRVADRTRTAVIEARVSRKKSEGLPPPPEEGPPLPDEEDELEDEEDELLLELDEDELLEEEEELEPLDDEDEEEPLVYSSAPRS